jgi:hypothetical protein
MSTKSSVRTRFDELDDALRAGDSATVRKLSAAARAEYLPVHDGLRDAVAATLSHAVDETSPEEGEAIGRRVIERLMQGGDAPQYSQAGLRERVEAIADGWHWHGTTFTVTEDDEKVTFHLGPCGSGMRLELEGRYDGAGAWHRSREPSPSTFMERGFPMYSNHCAEMSRIGLLNGSPTFVVEGWTPLRERGVCFQHTFKRLDDVPDEFFRRLGLDPPTTRDGAPPPPRLFDGEELEALATHPLDRALAACERGDVEAALAALDASRVAWRDSMHGAYRRWLASLWSEVRQAAGPEVLERTVEAAAPELVGHIRDGSEDDWAAFWSMHLGLRGRSARRFELAADALLEPDESPIGPAELCASLQQGAARRGWTSVGRFDADGDVIVHSLP